MKNQWNIKKRRKHLRSSKKIRPSEKRVGVIARGKTIGEESDLRSIIEYMLMDIVDQGGTISMSMDDGGLHISGEVGGVFLGGAPGQEEPR